MDKNHLEYAKKLAKNINTQKFPLSITNISREPLLKINSSIAIKGIRYLCGIENNIPFVAIEFNNNRELNEFYFDFITTYKEKATKYINTNIEWRRKIGRTKMCQIYYSNRNYTFENKSHHNNIDTFLLNTLYKFYDIFEKLLIKASLKKTQKENNNTYFNQYVINQGKLSKIKISKYIHFNNIEFDLTYPIGHEKEGLPLEKICLIGQSGTGKTNLLRLIKNIISSNSNKTANEIANKTQNTDNNEIAIELSLSDPKFKEHRVTINQTQNNLKYSITKNIDKEKLELLSDNKASNNIRLINFPFDIIKQIENLNIPDTFKNVSNNTKFKNKIIDFDIIKAGEIWNSILEEIKAYRDLEFKERVNLSKIVETADFNGIETAKKQFKQWQNEHPNPIKDLAENCLDKFLNKFNLKVKTELDFQKIEDIKFLKISTLQNDELGDLAHVLSTGTKQVILTAMPLYTLKPVNTIILYDELERSLYPDIQKEIIDFYVSLTTNCQLFFATHSPIIASNFEPWEILELKFNEKGEVYQELWYNDERHVNNYFKDPRLLRWDDILMKIYGLRGEGNNERSKKLTELAIIERDIELGKFENTTKEQKITEYMKLANKLGWQIETK